MPNHVWHGLRHSGNVLNKLSVSGSLLPKNLALPKHLDSNTMGEA